MSNEHLKACLAQIAQTNEESLTGFRELSRQTAQVRQSLENVTSELSKLDGSMSDMTTEVAATFRTEIGGSIANLETRLETRLDDIAGKVQHLIDHAPPGSGT